MKKGEKKVKHKSSKKNENENCHHEESKIFRMLQTQKQCLNRFFKKKYIVILPKEKKIVNRYSRKYMMIIMMMMTLLGC